jgi:hypothetical protein
VTNGLYTTGGRVVYDSLTNRVVINKAVTVQSINGPASTLIQGVPNGAVRCVYLTNNATLIGFTLTNGSTATSGDFFLSRSGGGVWCESTSSLVSNCVLIANSALIYGGASYSGTLVNCTLTNNSTASNTSQGGGAFGGVLTNCIITHNHAAFGGGAASNILFNCTLKGNWALKSGGGACSNILNNCMLITNWATISGGGTYLSVLTNCTLSGNWSTNGGGAAFGTLVGCTLTNNSASIGGGACSNVLNNCLLINNRAGSYGGGAFFCTLSNSTLKGNLASGGTTFTTGGGALGGTLYNCSISINFAVHGGGVASNSLNNCIVFSNSATDGGGTFYSTLNSCDVITNAATFQAGASYGSVLNNCIITKNYTPPGFGSSDTSLSVLTGCFGSGGSPAFVNLSGGDFHLQTNSPCINSGINSLVTSATDFDGNPRIVGGTVDIGAYEFQSPSSILPYAWAQQYGLPTDGSADYADSDGDGMNNWQEWIAGTIPTNAASVLALQTPRVTTTNATITWKSVSGVNYFIQRGSDLGAQPPFSPIQSNIVGQISTTSYTDTNAVGSGPFFYRVGVQ